MRYALFAAIATVIAGPAAAQQNAVPVTTVIAETRPIAETKDFVGRIEAIERVDVRARVTGFLEAILFKEGDLVKEGQPLYRIEQGLFKADVEQAEGALASGKAAKKFSKLELERALQLQASTYGTPQRVDQARNSDEQAAASIMKNEASLATAQINLGYTSINAPITGKIGRTKITKGNVVSPDSGPLTTIVSQDPMYVTFPVSQREFLRVRLEEEQEVKHGGEVDVSIRFSDGSLYDQKGRIDFVDVTVDRATDTVLVRAVVPNPKGVLIDGQLVRVKLEAGKPKEKVVVPQSALIADQEGVYVFAVENGKAVVRRVKVADEIGANIAIDSGLKPGEQVIVDGLQGVRPGAPVLAAPQAVNSVGG